MSAIVLLGAGASFGSGESFPYPPPLGGQLFDELVALRGVAAKLPETLATVFRRNFEEGMVAYREQRDVDTTALLREMGAFFAQFSPGPSNLYHRLVRAVSKSSRRTVFATTNYEMMLEIAITQAGWATAYQYRPIPKNISVLKIHGSCNFLPDLGTNVIRGARMSGNKVNVEAPVRVARSAAEIQQYCRNEDSLAPAISLYAPGKDILFSSRFVLQQQKQWQQGVAGASALYVVGLRVLPEDDHIWGHIASSRCGIYYVGREPEEFLSWAEENMHRKVFVLGSTLESALPIMSRKMSR